MQTAPTLSQSNDVVATACPEIDLLLCCARSRIDAVMAERIRGLLREKIDWDFLLPIAVKHGAIPMLYQSLKGVDADAVPQTVLDLLRQAFELNAQRNLFLTRELLRLLKQLAECDIPAVPFKGLVLAASVYGNLALRVFGDLDILVRKQDVGRAKQLVLSQDYRLLKPQLLMTPTQEVAYLEFQHEYLFERKDGQVCVEIQWCFASRSFSLQLNPDRLWERLESVSLAGSELPNFSPEDVLLLLCVDGCKGRWNNLRRVCDVAELIRARPDLNWSRLLEYASQLGSRRLLLLGLRLANELLGARLPEEIWQAIRADREVESLVCIVGERLFVPVRGTGDALKRVLYPLFHLRARERWRDRIRYCWLAMMPTAKDWEFVPLPEALSFLYYGLRPIRLVRRYVWLQLKKLLRN